MKMIIDMTATPILSVSDTFFSAGLANNRPTSDVLEHD